MASVGGFSPLINTWMIQHFNNNLMIAFYIMLCASISLIIVSRYLPVEYGLQRDLAKNLF